MTVFLILKSYFTSSSLYWKTKPKIHWVIFKFWALVFWFRETLINQFFSIRIFGSISFQSIIPIILVIVSVLLILLIPFIASQRFIGSFQLGVIPLNNLIINVPENSYPLYDGFLIGVVTVIGLFLTLYFTNVSSIVGSFYSQLSNNLRDLYIQERVGNSYIRFLVYLLMVSILLLGLGVMTEVRPKLVIFIIAILSLIAVQAFVFLSRRSFQFIDPTSLISTLQWQLGRHINNATINGFRWNDPVFQNHYLKLARINLQGISELVELSNEEDHLKTKTLELLLDQVLSLYTYYIQKKPKIPTDSLWFPKKAEHRYWYLSSDHLVNLATSTQTDITPEMRPNNYWIEHEVFRLHIKSLHLCYSENRLLTAAGILDNLNTFFGSLASEFELPNILIEFTSLQNMVFDSLKTIEKLAGQIDQPNLNNSFKLAQLDYLGLIPITILLNTVKRVETIEINSTNYWIAKNTWKSAKNIYNTDLPLPSLERLEFIHKRIQIEIFAEKKVVSPPWYSSQLIYESLATTIDKQLRSLLKISNDLYRKVADLSNEKNYLFAVQVISRGLEFCQKGISHYPKIGKFLSDLQEYHIEKSIRWPIVELENYLKEIRELEDYLLIEFAKLIPVLSEIPKIEGIPDYFGRAVHLAGEKSFEALYQNDPVSFEKIFPNYFLGTIRTFEILKEKTADWHTEQAASIFTDPIMDLVDLSGYAYVFSELHQNKDLWDFCKTIWDGYLHQLRKERSEMFAGIINYKSYEFRITPRSIIRTQWKMQIDRLFDSMPRVTRQLDTLSVVPHFESIIDHPSLIVRIYGGNDEWRFMSFYDGIDAFVEFYFRVFPESKELSFGRNRELGKTIERWQRRDAEKSEIDRTE
jgi:hypothetical protein